jgi:hypothetical protein
MHYEWNGNSLQSKHASNQSFATEMLGVGFSLVMMSCLFDGDIAAIDWSILPVGPVKTLDFMNAVSSANFYVQVECKGSVTDNPTVKSSTVSAHKADIEAKKVAQSGAKKGRYGIKRFGTIAVIPSANANTTDTICWLLDPPGPTTNTDPVRQRIINRLHGYAYWLSLMAPESHLVEALVNRNAALDALRAVAPLDNIPLIRTAGANSYFENIFSSVDLAVAGKIISAFFTATAVSANQILLFGITKSAIDIVENQRFSAISEYRAYSENSGFDTDIVVESSISSRHISGAKDGDSKPIAFRGSVFVDIGGTIFGVATVDEGEIGGSYLDDGKIGDDGLVAAERTLKHAAVKRLIESESFTLTHAAIAVAKRFIHNFTTFEANILCDVAQANSQIRYIFNDIDVTEFYSALVSHHSSDLNPDTLRIMFQMLGLAPTQRS